MNSVPSLSRGLQGIIDSLRLVSAFGVTAIVALTSAEAVVAGAKVTFLATAEGSPAPTFKWKKNGVEIPGATAATLIISSVSLSDAGTYRVTASNVAGSADSQDEVLLVDGAPAPSNVAPSFSTQPAAAVAATAGQAVNLSVVVNGYPAPALQWIRNGTPISGATSSSLSLPSVSTGDSGTYSVTATNLAGTVSSSSSLLTVSAPLVSNPPTTVSSVAPTITNQPPASQVVTVGSTADLAVVASGSPAPSYQWKKNGANIAGATASGLRISAAALTDTASYTVLVSNSAGSVLSASSALTVNAVTSQSVGPVVSTQPVSQTVTAGAAVTFSVVATGTPAPSYQWQKNGSPISGATNGTFVIPSVALSDGGNYSAVVSNLAGSLTSSTALLAVTSPVVTQPPLVYPPPPVSSSGGGSSTVTAPSISTQPQASQVAAVGSDVRLSVVASGSAVLSYQWRKNGSAVNGATGSSLLLSSVGTSDTGTYVVVVTNSAGSVTSAGAIVSVGGKPVFSTQPVGQAVNLGARVILNAVAIGSPAPTYQWTKNGATITGATGSSYVINSVRDTDFATYRMVATNNQGSTTSNAANLVLAAAPVISAQPVALSAASGSTATFSVTVAASPAPDFQWKKNGVKISGATNSTLVLSRISSSDAASYSVEASNSVGWVVSRPATLSVTAASSSGRRRANGSLEDETFVDGSEESRIVNLSVRSRAGSGDNALIVGFVVGAGSTKPMLLRGVGPALADFGVSDVLVDPKISLFSGSELTASNDDWALDSNAPKIASTGAILGAFNLREASADSAMLADLPAGAYTVQVGGKNSETGVALVEVYDAEASAPAALVNLSVRTFVGTGDEAPNLGFVVSGSVAKKVLIRAVGPTLGDFGVSGVLADPQLELFKNGARIAINDNWEGDSSLATAFTSVGAFGFANPNSKDAVLLATLEPGAYTVVASGVGGSTGIALVEVYDVP